MSTKQEAAPKSLDVIEAFGRATAEDLEEVRRRIAEHEQQIEVLRLIERVIDVRVNGRKPRAAPRKKAAAGGPAQPAGDDAALKTRRRQVATYLMAKGGKHKQKVSEELGISQFGRGCLSTVLACDWFHVNPDGMVTLTDRGEREARVSA